MTKAEERFIKNMNSFYEDSGHEVGITKRKNVKSVEFKTLFELPIEMEYFEYYSPIDNTLYQHIIEKSKKMYYEPNIKALVIFEPYSPRGFNG